MTDLALADANSFYCACERVFRPDLAGRPVIVLSNNDGCVVSRTRDIKHVIPMGAPWHEVRYEAAARGIVVFSSNYALYHELSQRMQAVMARYAGGVYEPYSIDECFLDLAAIPPAERVQVMTAMRQAILREVGIPVSVGVAATKVLAKLAAELAKDHPEGVRALANPAEIDQVLTQTPTTDLWGIGPARARALREMAIYTALHLKQADLAQIRRRLHVPVARIVCELRGIPALPLQTNYPPRREIVCARVFGQPLRTVEALGQAVATYAAAAARRLYAQHSVASTLSVSLMTNPFRPDQPQQHSSVITHLPQATNYPPDLIRAARAAIPQLFQSGLAYYRAGIMLMDLESDQLVQRQLFIADPDVKVQQLLATIRAIEQRFGRGAIFFAATGGPTPAWAMHQERRSPAYLTRWSALPVARA